MRRPPDIEIPREPEGQEEDKRGIDLVELSPMHVPDVQDVAESEDEIDSVTGLEQAVTPTPIVDNEGEESSEEEEEEVNEPKKPRLEGTATESRVAPTESRAETVQVVPCRSRNRSTSREAWERHLDDPAGNSLAEHWGRTGITGRGRTMVEQRTHDHRFGLVARAEPQTLTEAKLKFLSEDGRLRIPTTCAYNSYFGRPRTIRKRSDARP